VQHKNRRAKRKIRVAHSTSALEIWERYQGKLPVLTNQTMNAGIKTLARAAGLKHTVTTVRGIGAQRIVVTVPLSQAISCHTGRYTGRYTFITLQHEGSTSKGVSPQQKRPKKFFRAFLLGASRVLFRLPPEAHPHATGWAPHGH
jgi:hypothetical protein